MVADQGRVYLIEDKEEAIMQGDEEYDGAGRRLCVIDLETGRVLQKVCINAAHTLSGVALHDGCVFLSDTWRHCVFVLAIAQIETSAGA